MTAKRCSRRKSYEYRIKASLNQLGLGVMDLKKKKKKIGSGSVFGNNFLSGMRLKAIFDCIGLLIELLIV
jgi:hypothetical protein